MEIHARPMTTQHIEKIEELRAGRDYLRADRDKWQSIAEAIPDLLEALEDIIEIAARPAVIQIARAAIAKARGQ